MHLFFHTVYICLVAAGTRALRQLLLRHVQGKGEMAGKGTSHAGQAHVPVVDHEEHHDEETVSVGEGKEPGAHHVLRKGELTKGQ